MTGQSSIIRLNKRHGFTIVELLVVIVIIAILAAITIVSYTGISNRATVSALQSDLSNGANQLKLFQVDNSNYPTTIDCTIPDSTTNKCVKASNGNTFSYQASNSTNPQTFCITAIKSSNYYSVSNNGTVAPVAYCPVLYLDAGNISSYPGTGTTWTDLSGNGNSGTLYGGVSYNATNGGVLNFDGSTGYVSLLPPLPAGLTKYTMSAWWKQNTVVTSQVIYEQNLSALTTSRRSAIIALNGTTWGFNGQSNDAHYAVPLVSNQWTNGTITIDTALGTNPAKIYKNGILYWQGDTSAGASNLNIGAEQALIGKKISNSEYFNGSIGNVSVFNRVLTDTEILQNFNNSRGRYGI